MVETKKILLVDDDERVIDALGSRLKQEGFRLFAAKNGRQALELAFSEHPNLIVLDIVMPGMHGLEVIKILKEDKWGKNVPVVIITNFPDYPELGKMVRDFGYDLVSKMDSSLEGTVKKIRDKLNKPLK